MTLCGEEWDGLLVGDRKNRKSGKGSGDGDGDMIGGTFWPGVFICMFWLLIFLFFSLGVDGNGGRKRQKRPLWKIFFNKTCTKLHICPRSTRRKKFTETIPWIKKMYKRIHPKPSLSIPHPGNFCVPHLLLELKYPIHQCFARGWTTGHVDVNRNYSVAPPRHTITVVIIPAPVGARAHADHPARFRHLVVDLAQSRSHFVGQSSGHNHHVGLAGRGSKDYAQTILVVARGREVHHLYGTAGKPKSHRPERALASPVGDLVEGC